MKNDTYDKDLEEMAEIKIIVNYKDRRIPDETTYYGKARKKIWKRIRRYFGLRLT